MKTFKSIDLFIQAGLLLFISIALIMDDPDSLNPGPFILTFGAWQIISILANLAAGPQSWKMKALRKYHLLATALLVLLVIIAFIQNDAARTGDKDDKYSMAGLGLLIIITIPSVLVSLFYSVITFLEWRRIKK
jgi:uncharacterized membrane protein